LAESRRRALAGLTRAWTVPQFSVMIDVNVDQLMRARDRLAGRSGTVLPIEALLIRLALPAIDEFPQMNAMLDGGEVVLFERRDIAFSCITDHGLAMPVVRQVDRLSLDELGHSVTDLIHRAGHGNLEPTELGSQTFTVNEVGATGARAMIPLLPLATTAIVTYGRPQMVVQMLDDAPREAQVMTITGTFDHRVVDGDDATRFLATIGAFLQDPILAFAA
jgi:pyruvate dehydrogenase E2 component (dihydrolipoamide acetyltransferase)